MTTRGNDEFKEKILHELVWAIEIIMQQIMRNLMLPRVKGKKSGQEMGQPINSLVTAHKLCVFIKLSLTLY